MAVHKGLETWNNKETAQDENELRSLREQIRNKEASLLLEERELQSELERRQKLQKVIETELQRVQQKEL